MSIVKLTQDITDAMGEFIDKIVKIADEDGFDRDATMRRAVRMLEMFAQVASLEEYEVSEERRDK